MATIFDQWASERGVDPNTFGVNEDELKRRLAQMAMQKQQQAPAKKKPWWSSLISEAGGAGGMAGGAALGATVGSAVPGIGTILGGLLGGAIGGFTGGFGGRVAENKVRDNRLGLGDAAKEGAWDAILSGPLKALKGGYAASKALKAGSAVLPAFERGATTSLLKKGGLATLRKGVPETVAEMAGKNTRPFAAVQGQIEKLHNAGNDKGVQQVINTIADPEFKKSMQSIFGGGVSKVAPAATAAVEKKAGSTIPARMFARSFTVDKKLAPRLKPVDTARELMEHGVGGSLEKMGKTAAQVTGDNGILTKVTRDAVARIPGDIKVDDFMPAVRSSLDQGALIGKSDEAQILRSIFKMDRPGILPGTMSPVDALDNVKMLESLGYQFLNSSTKLSPNLKNEQMGKVYLNAADAIKDSLEKAVGSQDILQGFKTPQIINQIKQISPKLAEQFQNAKSLAEVRSIQAPFVRLNQMIGLTEDAAQTAGSQFFSGTGSKLGAGAVGFGMGGPPGAALGYFGAPIVEGLEQATRAPISTFAANLFKGGGKVGKKAGKVFDPFARSTAGSFMANGPGGASPAQAAGIDQFGTGTQGGFDPFAVKDSSGEQQSMADQFGAAGSPGMTPTAPETGLDYSSAELFNAAMKAYVAGDIPTAEALSGMADQASEFEQQLGTGAGTDLTAQQQKGLMGADTANTIVDQIDQSLSTLGTSGRAGGFFAKIAGKAGLNDAVSAYEAGRPSTALMLIKAIQGSAGNISDADRKAIEASIPSVSDTEGERANKLNRLRNIIYAYQSAASQDYGNVAPEQQQFDPFSQMSNSYGY